MSTRCTALVALGSNLGNREEQIAAALEAMASSFSVAPEASALYDTQPVGMTSGAGSVLNAVCRFETAERADVLVRGLLEIEDAAGRQRAGAGPSADRTLDLDLLLLGNHLSDTAAATVPHPRLHRRAFVLVPACDVGPELLHPLLGKTLTELLRELPLAEADQVRSGRQAPRRRRH